MSVPSSDESLNETLPLTPDQFGKHLHKPRDTDIATLMLERLGDFRLLSLIGQGGMGSVYLAEQDNPLRKVALKLMRLGSDDVESAQRFCREGATLARLDHPGIAKVYAAGVAETALGNLPYFAMEFVDGTTLIEHATTHHLDTPARLRLMVAICNAVQHAHQRGVIHRDLKPANILVDAYGQPRVLDFGIARLIDETEGGTRLTQMGELVGTLHYMSPEQLKGDTTAIDTRADVYALGVIAYELLSGRLPREFEANTSLMQAINHTLRGRPLPLAKANPACKGELDIITMKALAEDPAQRYGSASELGADIERYLHNEPILARAPSASYVARKFARRHRALVAATIVVVLALIGSTAFALNAAWHEREARQSAEHNAAISASVQQFMNDMFLAAMPEATLGREVTVREVVDQASLLLLHSPPKDRMVAAESGIALANVNLNLGRFEQAQQLISQANATLVGLGSQAGPARIDAAIIDIKVRNALGSDATVEQSARDLTANIHRTLGVNDTQVFDASNLLGEILLRQSKFSDAIVQFRTVLSAPINLLPVENQARETALANLAVALRGAGDIKGASDALLAMEKVMSSRHGANHPATLSVVNNLAIAIQNIGEPQKALALYDRAYEGRRRVLGPDHPDTLNVLQNRATLLIQTGRVAEAEPQLQQLLLTLKKSRQEDHPSVLVAMNSLAYALEDLDRLNEAEKIYRDALDIQIRAKSAHSETFGTRNNLAMLLMHKGDFVNAEREFKHVISLASEHLGGEHPYVLIFSNNYGECLARMHRYNEAETLLLRTHTALSKAMGADNPRVLKARTRLADLYDTLQRPKSAAEWRTLPSK